MTVLTIGTLNLKDGERVDLLPELTAQAGHLDLLFLQEGTRWHLNGQRARFDAEHALAGAGIDRSVMTGDKSRGAAHTLIFWDSRKLRLLAHHDPLWDEWMSQGIRGVAEFDAEGSGEVLRVKNVQWKFSDGDTRLGEARDVTWMASPGLAAVIGGDFNGLWPDCRQHQEFEPAWENLLPNKRHHKALPPGPDGTRVSDRRALAELAEAGFVSAACIAGDMTVTVNKWADNGEGAHIDHIAVSPSLAPCVLPDTYKVYVSEAGDQASDHRLVTVDLDLDRKVPAP